MSGTVLFPVSQSVRLLRLECDLLSRLCVLLRCAGDKREILLPFPGLHPEDYLLAVGLHVINFLLAYNGDERGEVGTGQRSQRKADLTDVQWNGHQ